MAHAVEQRFYHPRQPVAVADCPGVGHDAAFARSLLEQLGAAVYLHLIGTPKDLLEVLSQGKAAPPHLIICCHGDDNGLVFGEYASGIDTSMLVAGSMPPECIAKHIDLPGCVVLNMACGAGEPPMAEAFMSGKLKAYVGTVQPVPGSASGPLFLAHFFYQLLVRGRSDWDAWERAASYDESSRQYVFYDQDGPHRVG